jgi:orotate phosphoribosyltransferase
MSKATIYNDLYSSKIISAKEFIVSNEKPFIMNFNKVLSNPSLFDNITLLTEHLIKSNNLDFTKICAASVSAIPYATNIATSLEKGILYILDTCNDKTEKDNIKGMTIEGGMNIDDRILLIETVVNNDFHLNNIIQKIKKYGGKIVSVLILFNKNEGEYINIVNQNEKIITVLNIYEIFNHLETNNLIELFYCERVKFYCEKATKLNIKKLLENNDKSEDEVKELNKELFVGQ